jgi:hypothetical protein
LSDAELKFVLLEVIKNQSRVVIDRSRKSIKEWIGQPMYDFKRSPSKHERDSKSIYGGLPYKDKRRKNKKTYGISEGQYIGFMDDVTPVRVRQDNLGRLSNLPDRVWFRLDTAVKDVNKSKCFNGPTDNRSYCAYNLLSSKISFSWFSISKAINARYPTWANQFDIWPPSIITKHEDYYYALCFAFVLAENRCVVTKFEENNPVEGAPEIFVDNPLCPANPESFWSQVLDKEIIVKHELAFLLTNKIKELYRTWNIKYCKGDYIYQVGLEDEPYFKYFDYASFLTPYSGLIQIRKYAELNALNDINILFTEISELTKKVKEEIYRLLIEEFKYFE